MDSDGGFLVVEAQRGDQECVSLYSIDHAMLIGCTAGSES